MNYNINRKIEELEENITGVYMTGYIFPRWYFCGLMGDRPVTYYLSPFWEPQCTSHLPYEIDRYIPFPNGHNLRTIKKNAQAWWDFKSKNSL